MAPIRRRTRFRRCYRAFARYALGARKPDFAFGPQPRRIGDTGLFVAPNPSPANAHFRPADQVTWYDRLADWLEGPDRRRAEDGSAGQGGRGSVPD